MLSINNYLPILVAAGVYMGIGVVCYSDAVLGKTWKKLGGCKINGKNLQQKFGMQAVASILTATALMIAINVFDQYQGGATQSGFSQIFSWFLDKSDGPSMMNAMKTAAFFWLGFSMPALAAVMIWCETKLHKFLIDAGCELVALAAMAAVLSSLS